MDANAAEIPRGVDLGCVAQVTTLIDAGADRPLDHFDCAFDERNAWTGTGQQIVRLNGNFIIGGVFWNTVVHDELETHEGINGPGDECLDGGVITGSELGTTNAAIKHIAQLTGGQHDASLHSWVDFSIHEDFGHLDQLAKGHPGGATFSNHVVRASGIGLGGVPKLADDDVAQGGLVNQVIEVTIVLRGVVHHILRGRQDELPQVVRVVLVEHLADVVVPAEGPAGVGDDVLDVGDAHTLRAETGLGSANAVEALALAGEADGIDKRISARLLLLESGNPVVVELGGIVGGN